MFDSEDSFGWCSDHSKRVEMSDSDGNDFMTHPEVNSYIVKKEKIEQFLSLEDNGFQSTATVKRKKKVKSVVASTCDDEVQDVDNYVNNESFPKKKHKKKKKDDKRNSNDLNEDNIKVENENNDKNTSNRIKMDISENDVTNEEPSTKKNKKRTEIPVPENNIYLSNDCIESDISQKKKKKKHQRKEQISGKNSNFTEDITTTSIKKLKKKSQNTESFDEEEMTTDRARNLLRKDSFHYESSDSNDRKNINSQHRSIEDHIEADVQSEVASTQIKQESRKGKKKNNRESDIQNTHEPSNDNLVCIDNGANVKKEKTERKIKRESDNSMSSEASDSSKQQVEERAFISPIISETKNSISRNERNDNKNSSDDESSDNTRRRTSDGKGKERSKSVSENIHFEDDDSESGRVSDHASINSEYNLNNNNKFGRVLEHFKTLKIEKQVFDPKLQINPSHDLFLLKCPRNLDINQLVGASMAMDGKSKFKIENKIYECIFENNEKQYRSIMSPSKKSGEYRLQSIITQGEMRLRRKLPKPNIANHMAAVKSHTFMPLPETKRRHPLFGIEYKPMIKINKRVAERLQEAHTIASTAIVKKKKKVKPELTDLDISIKKNKKRKRKASDSESISEVEPKKFKRDPEKSEWDSEKHIAQSLFAGL